MTPQEQKLIQGVADRLRNANLTEKDAEADSFIRREIGAQADSIYILTQAVILQEQALKQAERQIDNLKKRVEQAREQTEKAAQPPPGSSFLGGLFGGGARQQSAPLSPRPAGMAAQRDPWGSGGASAASPGAGAAGGGFGSFMRGAASVAVGVAGGYLLANALTDMLSDEDTDTEQAAEQDSTDTEAAIDEPLPEAEEASGEYSEFADDYDSDAGFGGGEDDFGDDDWA